MNIADDDDDIFEEYEIKLEVIATNMTKKHSPKIVWELSINDAFKLTGLSDYRLISNCLIEKYNNIFILN